MGGCGEGFLSVGKYATPLSTLNHEKQKEGEACASPSCAAVAAGFLTS